MGRLEPGAVRSKGHAFVARTVGRLARSYKWLSAQDRLECGASPFTPRMSIGITTSKGWRRCWNDRAVLMFRSVISFRRSAMSRLGIFGTAVLSLALASAAPAMAAGRGGGG